MDIQIECFPCWIRQAVEASKAATDDQEIQKEILKESCKIVSNAYAYKNSPQLAKDIQQMVKTLSKNEDPYINIKKKSTKIAYRVMPLIERYLAENNYSMYSVMRASGVGNMLDAAVYGENASIHEDEIFEELNKPFLINDLDIFEERYSKANKILIIGDNTGEHILDKILIDKFSDMNVFYAVRDKPMLNDVTVTEAIADGLDKKAKVISTGSDVAGIMLDLCSNEFLKIYYEADIVILKGMGNFESLDTPNREVFFLFKAKCDTVADYVSLEKNSYVFMSKE